MSISDLESCCTLRFSIHQNETSFGCDCNEELLVSPCLCVRMQELENHTGQIFIKFDIG
jgi:hypothetical protein